MPPSLTAATQGCIASLGSYSFVQLLMCSRERVLLCLSSHFTKCPRKRRDAQENTIQDINYFRDEWLVFCVEFKLIKVWKTKKWIGHRLIISFTIALRDMNALITLWLEILVLHCKGFYICQFTKGWWYFFVPNISKTFDAQYLVPVVFLHFGMMSRIYE